MVDIKYETTDTQKTITIMQSVRDILQKYELNPTEFITVSAQIIDDAMNRVPVGDRNPAEIKEFHLALENKLIDFLQKLQAFPE